MKLLRVLFHNFRKDAQPLFLNILNKIRQIRKFKSEKIKLSSLLMGAIAIGWWSLLNQQLFSNLLIVRSQLNLATL